MKYQFIALFTILAFAKAYAQEISPQTAVVDVKSIAASLNLDFEGQSVAGTVETTFTMLESANKVVLDAHHMTIEDQTPLFKITATDSTLIFNGKFEAGGTYKALFSYAATPTQAAYFVNNKGEDQFWTQGQGKYTSHWLPSLDDMNDKIVFDIKVTGHANKTVIANGEPEITLKDYNVLISQFDMDRPIPSYLVALIAGKYDKKIETSTSGTPIEYYYYPSDSLNVEPTYRYSKQVFDFLETEIGVPYPWNIYKHVPVKDFLYAGMENASCTVFSDNFMVDDVGFTDRNYVNVNAHELAHQWFGDLVTETKSDHHWLHEGFATYYALLAEREIFGDDYFYFKLFESAEQLRELSDAGKGQKLVASGGSSLTYYQKGAWAVHILREMVGEDAFAKAVTTYLEKHAYQNVTTDDFMASVEAATNKDLTDFKNNWLYQSAFQAQDAVTSLKRSPFMQQYFQLQSGRNVPLESKLQQLMSAVLSGNEYLGQEAVYQLEGEPISKILSVYKAGMVSDNVFIRQAIATSITQLPKELILDFYSLLEDDSYITREQAFIKLWVYFQQEGDGESQRTLLDQMDGVYGFADGNIRTLWLTLSLATPAYKPSESVSRYQELIDFTAPEYPFKLRQNAFQYLRQLDSFEEKSLHSLIEASVHHVWRFRESARELLKVEFKKPKNTPIFDSIERDLSDKEKAYLERLRG